MVSYADGRNPLRWDCTKQGCFNEKKRPKIEMFAECLPGKLAFSDIDGITEVNSKFLIIEWKSYEGDIPTGQRIMFERMTASGQFTVFVVNGDAETMVIQSMCVVWNGKVKPWMKCDIGYLKSKITRWAAWAKMEC